MYCEKCKIAFTGHACPFCGEEHGAEKNHIVPVTVSRRNKTYIIILTVCLCVAALLASLIDGIVSGQFFIFFNLAIVAVYVMYTVRYTVLVQGNKMKKISGQAMAGTIILGLLSLLHSKDGIILSVLMPVFIFACLELLCVEAMKKYRDIEKSAVRIFGVCILGVVPIIIAFCADLMFKWTAIVLAGVSVAVAMTLFIVKGREVLVQIKRFFQVS